MEEIFVGLRQLRAGAISEDRFFQQAALSVTGLAEQCRYTRGPANRDVESTADPPEFELVTDGTTDPPEFSHQDPNVAEVVDGLARMDEDAALYTWGNATDYQLGFGTTSTEMLIPRRVLLPNSVQIRSVACGRSHSAVTTFCGSIFVWGFGGNTGKLGIIRNDASSAAASSASASKASLTLVEPNCIPEFGAGNKQHFALKVAVGQAHTVALTDQGRVLSWGSNACGQLGLQAVPAEDAMPRPAVVRALKGEEVLDIAAGLEHTLCVTKGGGVFVWGSNSSGSLGLGMPPIGPHLVASPQQLPHLKAAKAVLANATSRVSVVFVAQGGVVIFGGAPAGKRDADGASNFYLPSRVRRQVDIRSTSTGMSAEEEWQTQSGGRNAVGGAQGAPALSLRSVALGDQQAFGIDEVGMLWRWSVAVRPCSAEQVVVRAQPALNKRGSSPKLTWDCQTQLRFKSLASSNRTGCLWALDDSSAACLWRLQPSDKIFQAERLEHVAQVTQFACGPQHCAALVACRRLAATDRLLSSTSCRQQKEDDFDPPQQAVTHDDLHQRFAVPSLQQICEERLCDSLTLHNLPVVCDLAWELRRAALLDRTFAFFRANEALLLSRNFLPFLGHMSVEVLAAFEMASRGELERPSSALDLDPLDFPPEHMREGATAVLGVAATSPDAPIRRRKRGTATSGTPLSKPHSSPSACTAASPAATSGASPSASPSAQPKPLPNAAWTEVARRKASGASAPGNPSPHARCSLASLPNAIVALPGSPKLEHQAASPSSLAPAPSGMSLGDFVLPLAKQKTRRTSASIASEATGPSALLSAAVQNVQASWTARPEAESPSMREILQEASATPKALGTKTGASMKAKSVDSKSAGERKRSASEADTKCSWGFDALPSEKPKNDSMYSIQEQEQEEQEKQRQLDEIHEIEAMFEALEVAEREDIMEQEGNTQETTAERIKDTKSSKQTREKTALVESRGRNCGRDASAQSGWKKGWTGRSGWGTGWNRCDWTGRGWSGWQEDDRKWVPRGAAESSQETDP